MELSAQDKDNVCFACGRDNPIGLKLVFRMEGDRAVAEFTPGQWHQSWNGVFHGGLMATLLDEALGYVLYFRGIKALTAKFEMRLRKVVHTGQTVRVWAEITRLTRKIVDCRMGAELEDGSLVAEATATTWILRRDEPPTLAEGAG
ncbi:MAG: PaaI family thioesterase [Dehalococcoidia bacterium]|nr:PaaI family thioesterase [Dehalococcoidia bacterium]